MNTIQKTLGTSALVILVAGLMGGCLGEEPEGLAKAQAASTTVKMDFFHRPLPEIPLPNDIATRYDESSPTKRRINASLVAPTAMEREVRELIDELDGWGVYQPITIPFTGPLDFQAIVDAHHDDNYDTSDDLIYLINIDEDSAKFGQIHHLDVGNGNYPVVLEQLGGYWKNDPRAHTISLLFEETDEDVNGNGVLDMGEDANRNGVLDAGEDLDGDGVLDLPEDTDADGVLDKPNYYPWANPDPNNLAERADALMPFFELQTNTLIAKPMVPLEERTTYAVVVTRRLKDAEGNPVGSPFESINHVDQTRDLKSLLKVLPDGITLQDVAFTWSFTTQTVQSDWVAVYEGLHGKGVQGHLGEEFPARLASIEPLQDGDFFPNDQNLHVLETEDILTPLELLATQLLGLEDGSKEFEEAISAQRYIDYHVIGSYNSPQLFARTDDEGNPLSYNRQSWPQDLTQKAAPARNEQIYFWLTVPRPEISARGQGRPAPVVLLGHGYTSNRLEALLFSGFMARHGFAVLAIENVSHGLEVSEDDARLADLLLGSLGLGPFFEAANKSRAFDQNNDGRPDSGADFWSAYLFHTRDVVRQSVLDYIQLIRVLNSFDGKRNWDYDLNGDGQNELAGDFDGDGQIDIGLQSDLFATGGSLGGFMSSLLGALEPSMVAVAPIAGGGGISDLGIRSIQGGVREAFILRVLGPLYVGTLDGETGELLVETVVADLNDDKVRPVARVSGLGPGDTMVVENLSNDERACGYILAQGTVRAGLASDKGDRLRISFYKGAALVPGSTECELVEGLEPHVTIESFGAEEFDYQGELYSPGMDLVALDQGLGLRRADPELRRFVPLGQLVLDPADPAVYARHFHDEPLHYPLLGTKTGSHAMIITTLGDMNVPASGGVTMGRAAGFIDYLNPDPRYNKPQNQVFIDNYVNEAVHLYARHTDPAGNGVHIDVENFAEGTDLWGEEIPRLDPPLRLWSDVDLEGNPRGGVSGAVFPFPIPEGQHGFPFPGALPDMAKERCEDACPEGQQCDCDNIETFDVGHYMFNMTGEYFRTRGRVVRADLCHSRDDCDYKLPTPPARR